MSEMNPNSALDTKLKTRRLGHDLEGYNENLGKLSIVALTTR